ncbi:MBL fold metallo-hydrolase [Shewanella intestini]|uniref:Hydrolase n=1 Tax=Shewanella intestini TaxID=2017544 RepID=A0ABS5I4Y4_9GAMM|nr:MULTISPECIES: MBL fold metallo-hydrolase [Shewanella]MBR9729090.1 hydrolase [Shewanella intestini]MRG37166.1 hydrolase [Shewanella sp. XMDDZSB0408]
MPSNHTQQLINGKYQNTEISYQTGLADFWRITKAYLTQKRDAPSPTQAIPVTSLTKQQLMSEQHDAVYRLGHSTILMRIDNAFLLLDPVFSERASPVQWAGPKRFHQSPIRLDELPPISAVIISHDHYDHLDKATIEYLATQVDHFITPSKVGEHLIHWGVAPERITELSWWQSVNIGSIKLTATPAQHFSGRGLFDRDQTLWASWVIAGQQHKVFFSGDGGYFSGFKTIGERFGPFDLTLIETGAYNELWLDIHMMPQQSLQAHIDLNGKAMLPIHNGTFDLALHDWFEPFEQISQLAAVHQITLLTPVFGEEVIIGHSTITRPWWKPFSQQQPDLHIATE